MSFSKTGLYNISKKLQHPENYQSLYKSKFFTCMIFCTQPKYLQTSSKAANQHLDTNNCSPHYSQVYIPFYAAKRILSPKIPLYISRLRSTKLDSQNRHTTRSRLSQTSFQTRKHYPMVVSWYVRPGQIPITQTPYFLRRWDDLLQQIRNGDSVLLTRRRVESIDCKPPQTGYHCVWKREELVLPSEYLLIHALDYISNHNHYSFRSIHKLFSLITSKKVAVPVIIYA